MTVDDFSRLLDRCGGDPATWPAGAEQGARRLLCGSAEARAMLGAQQAVDGWFAATAVGAVPRDVAARAVSAPQLSPEPSSPLSRWGVGAAAAAALLAVGLGAATGVRHAAVEEPAQALAQALATPAEAVDAG